MSQGASRRRRRACGRGGSPWTAGGRGTSEPSTSLCLRPPRSLGEPERTAHRHRAPPRWGGPRRRGSHQASIAAQLSVEMPSAATSSLASAETPAGGPGGGAGVAIGLAPALSQRPRRTPVRRVRPRFSQEQLRPAPPTSMGRIVRLSRAFVLEVLPRAPEVPVVAVFFDPVHAEL